MADLGCAPNAAIAFDFFLSRGLSDVQAAAIVGNLQWESRIDPTLAVMDSNGLPSRGIAMWQPARWQNLLTFAAGRDPLALNTQLDFLWNELPSYGLSRLRSATQLADAVVVFQNLFEKPNASLAHTDKRIAMAQAALYACPSVRPPPSVPRSKTASKIAVAVGIVAALTAASYGAYKVFAAKPAPRPLPPPPKRYPLPPQRVYPPVYRPMPSRAWVP